MIALAMGCDVIHIALEAMISIGCIQAQRCHTDHCPTGITTHNRWLQGGLDIEDKAVRFTRYIRTFRKELLSLAHAMGYEHPVQVSDDDIEFSTGSNTFTTLRELLGYSRDPTDFTKMKDYQPIT